MVAIALQFVACVLLCRYGFPACCFTIVRLIIAVVLIGGCYGISGGCYSVAKQLLRYLR